MDLMTSKEPSTSSGHPPLVMSGVMCTMCSMKFASIKLLNRHKQRIHKIVSPSRKSRIICPLCEERHELKTHGSLRYHLVDKHSVNIELLILKFSSIQEYETWKNEENIGTCYAMHRTKRLNNYKEVNYICNRSDYKGYQANYQRRREKSGGTIRIQGMCPSKLTCKLYDNGMVSLAFWKTHIGHERELRSLHLSKAEQDIIVNKMKSGVSIDRILDDARNLKEPELQRLNLINRNNIIYLARKHNIDIKRDCNEKVAAALKVQERNGNKAEKTEENSVIESEIKREIEQLNEEKLTEQVLEKLEDQDNREVIWKNFKNWAEALNDEIFSRFMNNIQGEVRKADQAKRRLCNEGKMETQEFFPTKNH